MLEATHYTKVYDTSKFDLGSRMGNITIRLRDYDDPAIRALLETNGTFDFGLSSRVKLVLSIIGLALSTIVMIFTIFTCLKHTKERKQQKEQERSRRNIDVKRKNLEAYAQSDEERDFSAPDKDSDEDQYREVEQIDTTLEHNQGNLSYDDQNNDDKLINT